MAEIEMGKKYRTRDGREVRIYAVDAGGNYPVHGAILYGDEWVQHSWNLRGCFNICGRLDGRDLIEVKRKRTVKIEGWVAAFQDTGVPPMFFQSVPKDFPPASHTSRFYGIKPCAIEAEIEEDEGL